MKKKLSVLFISLLLISACQDIERTERPDNLIGEDKMVDVLTELSILQSARNLNRNIIEEAGIQPENYIYKKYNIDSLQFQESNDYYSENFTIYEGIFQRVKERLEKIKTIRDSIREEEVRIEDSIARMDSIHRDSIKELPGEDAISPDSLAPPVKYRRNREN
ncbi:DUF4296 domain-containing protein [Autumnicola musiva]|uniref:DUF4296 domain-containing protein n=1 Tax=Autumnicola musiva TaxID=3075589 RepID=A0ABU3D0V3_9FLAO|nr:DUF4296 domain-containing protein [Zunongwangia sp. F117]MDT0675137.1 DUF4296 domain-containing protein [Zunongwangia sp. F117]